MLKQETVYGYPLVTAENVYEVLAQLGIVPWKKIGEPIPIQKYANQNLGSGERKDLTKYSPKNEAATFRHPLTGNRYVAFRSTGRNWQSTFTLLPNPNDPNDELVIIVGEWKQGTEQVVLNPPSGVPTEEDLLDKNPFATCAQRIFQNETGIRLQNVIPLSETAIGISTRQSTQAFYPFLGITENPLEKGSAKLDDRELLKAVLIPLSEWIKLIKQGRVLEDCSISTTFLALLYLNKLKFWSP